jgi:hypothetical protein
MITLFLFIWAIFVAIVWVFLIKKDVNNAPEVDEFEKLIK